MARLIFEKASITDAGTTTSTDDAANISGIVTDSITMSEEALQVIIEDNQNVNEGYTSTMSFRTRNLVGVTVTGKSSIQKLTKKLASPCSGKS